MKNRRSMQGFSMIELLVAVLVMGIGVLGITGLQMVSLQNNRGALLRGEAVMLAYDMMDRIRANPGANYDGLALDAGPAAATDCTAGACSEADMATFDQSSWKCSLGAYNTDAVCVGLRAAGVLPPVTAQPGLPTGDGAIDVIGAAPNQVVRITVRWQEPNAQNPTTIVIDSQG
jgi:type IV pilus assembly protein PilV